MTIQNHHLKNQINLKEKMLNMKHHKIHLLNHANMKELIETETDTEITEIIEEIITLVLNKENHHLHL